MPPDRLAAIAAAARRIAELEAKATPGPLHVESDELASLLMRAAESLLRLSRDVREEEGRREKVEGKSDAMRKLVGKMRAELSELRQGCSRVLDEKCRIIYALVDRCEEACSFRDEALAELDTARRTIGQLRGGKSALKGGE